MIRFSLKIKILTPNIKYQRINGKNWTDFIIVKYKNFDFLKAPYFCRINLSLTLCCETSGFNRWSFWITGPLKSAFLIRPEHPCWQGVYTNAKTQIPTCVSPEISSINYVENIIIRQNRGGGGIEVINREPKQVSKLIWLWGLGRLFLEKCIITFNKSVANFIIFGVYTFLVFI